MRHKKIARKGFCVYNGNNQKGEGEIGLTKWNELSFEWDYDKAESNLKKHGISFETAALVFQDKNSLEEYDAAHSIDEDRYHIIGKVGEVIFVVYTERRERIRIISARIATSEERRRYYDRYLYP